MTKCADNAVLDVVSPQIRRLWTYMIPETSRNVSSTTEKLISRGIPIIEIHMHIYDLQRSWKEMLDYILTKTLFWCYLPLVHS